MRLAVTDDVFQWINSVGRYENITWNKVKQLSKVGKWETTSGRLPLW